MIEHETPTRIIPNIGPFYADYLHSKLIDANNGANFGQNPGYYS